MPGFCSPWWYYCVPGGFVPVDSVVGDRSSTDFGMVFGAGVNIAASDAASVYLEFRYHYIWGPEINPSEAASLTGTTGETGQWAVPADHRGDSLLARAPLTCVLPPLESKNQLVRAQKGHVS